MAITRNDNVSKDIIQPIRHPCRYKLDDIVINFKLVDHYHIRRYANGAWVADSMLDLDPRGIPTPRWARAGKFQSGTNPGVAQSDFDNDGLSVETEKEFISTSHG
jgi:hypothetical protein